MSDALEDKAGPRVTSTVYSSIHAALEAMRPACLWDFGAEFQAPIHPAIGAALDMKWWSPGLLNRRKNDWMGFEEYMRRQICFLGQVKAGSTRP